MASHIVGGDIQYRCLGNNQYEISLTVRRDCLNGNPGAGFDDPAHVGIFSSTGVLLTNLGVNGVLRMQLLNNDTLNEIVSKNCGIIGGDVCVHTTSYKEIITLPFRTGGYIFAYQRCCRNITINNILNPQATGATYTVEIKEDALRLCNSSPVLGDFPPIYICGGNPIDFDLHIKDAEGDSVVYKLCTPYVGADQANPLPTTPSNPPYDIVQFRIPYSLNNLIGGIPPLNIDSKTGRMTGFAEPNVAQYLIAYCVEEYRNGVLLSVMRRDFQINVRICSSVPEAEFKTEYDVCAVPTELSCIDQSKDNFSNIISWSWTFNDGTNVLNSNLQNPKFTIQKEGIVDLQLIIRSSSGCEDTITKSINIKVQKPEADFSFDYLVCKLPTDLKLTDLSKDIYGNIVNRTWLLFDGFTQLTSNEKNPTFPLKKEGNYKIVLIITSSTGCKDTIFNDIDVKIIKPKADFKSLISNCKLPVSLNITDLSNDPFSNIISRKWTVNDGTNIFNSTLTNPNFALNKEGIVRIELIIESSSTCSDTIRKEIEVKIVRPIFDHKADTICRNDTIQIKGSFPTSLKYEWSPKEGLSCTDCPNPFAFPKNSTLYILKSTGDSCERFDTVDIHVKTCFVDPCEIFVVVKCLANGMIEVRVEDEFGRLVVTKNLDHELFWNISANSKHSQYIIRNQNPILLFSGDEYSLTSSYYTWIPGSPKSIENAIICTKRMKKKIELNCTGPCKDLEFILSSCKDDYHTANNLIWPQNICMSVCNDSCLFVVGLFEKNGHLINPSNYDINWSVGGSGAYVKMMQPYYNTLSVEVKKGDCVWRGKYIKACANYVKIDELEILTRTKTINYDEYIDMLFSIYPNGAIYNITGQKLAGNSLEYKILSPQIYFFRYEEYGEIKVIRLIKSNY